MGLNAASMDTRIKAAVTSAMYDMSRVNAKGYFDSMDEKARYELRQTLNKQRTEDFKNGTYAPGSGLPDKLTGKNHNLLKTIGVIIRQNAVFISAQLILTGTGI